MGAGQSEAKEGRRPLGLGRLERECGEKTVDGSISRNPSQLEDSIWPLWNQRSDYFCQWGGSMALLLGANLKQALLFLLQPSAARKLSSVLVSFNCQIDTGYSHLRRQPQTNHPNRMGPWAHL